MSHLKFTILYSVFEICNCVFEIKHQIEHTEFQIQNFLSLVLMDPQKKLLLDVATFFYKARIRRSASEVIIYKKLNFPL